MAKKRLQLDKLVKSEKEAKKSQLIREANEILSSFSNELNRNHQGFYLK